MKNLENFNDSVNREIKNQVQLIGNLGQTPVLGKTITGKSWTRFSLATNEEYQNSFEKKTISYWHNIVAWGKTAEYISENCKKGNEVVVIGRLINRVYQSKEGIKRYITEVVVNNLICANQCANQIEE